MGKVKINISNFLKVKIFVFFLYLQYFSDGVNKYIVYNNREEFEIGNFQAFSLSIIVRSIFEIICIFFIFISINKFKIVTLSNILIIFIIYLFGMIFFSFNNTSYPFFYHLSLFNKYIFVFIIFTCYYFVEKDNFLLNKLCNAIINIFALNSILSIIGLIFNIKYFESYYSQDYRYGYNGVFPSVNESTLFYMIALTMLYINRTLKNKISSFKEYVIFLGALLLGTKSIYIFILGGLIFIFIKSNSLSNLINKGILIILVLVTVLVLLNSDFIQMKLGFFIQLYQNTSFLSMLMSGRDLYIIEKVNLNISKWYFINFFMGGMNHSISTTEMDFIDLFLLFGFLGFILIIKLYYDIFFKEISKYSIGLFFIFFYVVFAFFGGHFLSSAINSSYLFIFITYLKNNLVK